MIGVAWAHSHEWVTLDHLTIWPSDNLTTHQADPISSLYFGHDWALQSWPDTHGTASKPMCIFQIQVVLRISWLLLLSQTALVTPHPLLLQAILKEGLDCLFCTAFHTVSNYTLPMHCRVDGKNYEVLNWQVNQFNSSSNVINFKELISKLGLYYSETFIWMVTL